MGKRKPLSRPESGQCDVSLMCAVRDFKRMNLALVNTAFMHIGNTFKTLDLTGPETLLVLAQAGAAFCACWPRGQAAVAQVFEGLAKSIKDGKPGEIDTHDFLPLIDWSTLSSGN